MKVLWSVLMGVLAMAATAHLLEKMTDRPPAPEPDSPEVMIDLSHFPPYLLTSFRGPAIPRA